MGGDRKRKPESSPITFAPPTKITLKLPAPPIVYRDVYVHASPEPGKSVLYLKDDSDGGIYRTSACYLGEGTNTRLHYVNVVRDVKFSDDFKRTIDQVHVNLYLRERSSRPVAVQLTELWRLLVGLPDTVVKVVVRLADQEEHSLRVGDRIGGYMVYDDSLFFDVDKVIALCKRHEHVELHAKCNAIGWENVHKLVEFLSCFVRRRRLIVYISEFIYYLKQIKVWLGKGLQWKTKTKSVQVIQTAEHVTVKIGSVRIQFEDEFQALEFRNFE